MPIKTRSQTRNEISHTAYKLVFIDPIEKETRFNIFGIAELGIPRFGRNNENRIVANSNFAKYRCDRAYVMKITSLDGKKEYVMGYSVFNRGGYYYTGNWIEADTFNPNPQDICVGGIHYYLTRDAVISLFMSTYTDFNTTLIFDNIFTNVHLYNVFNNPSIAVVDDDGHIEGEAEYNNRFLNKLIYYDENGKIIREKVLKIYFTGCNQEVKMSIYDGDKHLMKSSGNMICQAYDLQEL